MRRAVVKNADMSGDMQRDAVDIATTALVRSLNIISHSNWLTPFLHSSSSSPSSHRTFSSHYSPSVPLSQSKYGIEKDVAAYIKKEFDKKHHPTWHCVVRF